MDRVENWLVSDSEDFQLVLFFTLLFALLILEKLVHFRGVSTAGRWRTNFILTVLAIFTMMAIPFSFITAANFAERNQIGLFNWVPLNWWALGLLTLLLRGFISFFTHFLAHKIPWFWRVHRVHHLDTEMDVSTTVRFHPLEFLINSLVGIPLVLLFGFPVWGLMAYELLDVAITLISHANISFPKKIENYLKYVIVTPDLHRIHHSSYQPETDSNFSAVFPIWDILFKTFRSRPPEIQQKMQLGLEEIRDQRTVSIKWLLGSPFKSFDKETKT